MESAEPPSKSRRFILRALVVLLLIAAVFGGYMRYSSQRTGNQQVYDNLAVFGARLQNLENTTQLHEKRIADLEEKVTAAKATPLSPAVPSASASDKDEERIAGLEKQIAALKSASPSESAGAQGNADVMQAIALLSTFHHLSDKVMSGKPYATELSAFEEQMGKDAAADKLLAALAPNAENGIPTFAQLLASFDDATDQLTLAQSTPPAGSTLWQRFVFNLSHLITIHKIDETQAGTTVDAIVGRASAHLEREEIEAAIAEIKSLPDDARVSFAPWLEDAQSAMEAPGIIDALEERVMQKAFHADAPAEKPANPQ